jgi:hypothetical protein
MKQSEINWRSGEVMIWGIDDLDQSKSPESQTDILVEDLLLVRFGKTIILDLGWYPEFNSNGQFVLSVVRCKNNNCEDWENPVLQLKFRDMTVFVQNLNQAIEVANSLMNSTRQQ